VEPHRSVVSFFLHLPTHAYRFPEQLEQDFPYWKRLHGFWRTLPNFNPYTASSEPGQDLAAEALALVQGRGQNNYDDNEDIYADPTTGGDDDSDAQLVNKDTQPEPEVRTQLLLFCVACDD
jgi:hypothetical protein